MQCPVCEEQLDVSQQAFEAHVDAHFDTLGESSTRSGPDGQVEAGCDATCFVCGVSLDGLNGNERQQHVNGCLGEYGVVTLTPDGPDATGENDWSATHRDHSREKQPVDKGDRW